MTPTLIDELTRRLNDSVPGKGHYFTDSEVSAILATLRAVKDGQQSAPGWAKDAIAALITRMDEHDSYNENTGLEAAVQELETLDKAAPGREG